MTISVVTPWLNHIELVDDYLAAIRDDPPDEVLIVDNGSDHPLRFADDVTFIRCERNIGFSRACNVGLEAATSDVVLFLNNDIAMVESGWLAQVKAAVEPFHLVGASLRYDTHGDVDGHQFPYLDGWCLAGMRHDLIEIGGWDETLVTPEYYSDNLLALRARLAGFTLRECRVSLAHKGSMTAGPHTNHMPELQMNYTRFADTVRETVLT